MMKWIIFSLFALMLLIPSLASAQGIKEGDTAPIPSDTWAEVKNLEPVESGNDDFAYGESCGIQYGGTVKVVGIDGGRLLVRYSIDGRQFGASCPSGVLFFVTKKEFSKMTTEYHKTKQVEEREKALIRRLTEK